VLVTVTALAVTPVATSAFGAGPPNRTTFHLFPNGPQLPCLSKPGDPQAPLAEVDVHRGELNDTLTLRLHHFKPGLQFDLFTVQHSPFLANGTKDPAFTGSFGLAWYQSDVQVDSNGDEEVSIKTILLDQIFGFDADTGLAPTNTFHVGFWFNDPADASGCGFTGFTPFNGEHHAGPLAFITRPDATTNLGPLCTDPTTTGTTTTCNP
jgi:hypothetical protein